MSEKEKLNQDEIVEEAAELEADAEAAAEKATEAAKPAKEPKAKKDSKPKSDKDKKPGLGKRLSRFFREMKAELKKVSWPTRAETLKKTGIVIASVIIVGIIVWLFDTLAGAIIDALLSLFGNH